MRLNTFTGFAVVFGKERPVTSGPPAQSGYEAHASDPHGHVLMVGGMSAEEILRALVVLESAPEGGKPKAEGAVAKPAEGKAAPATATQTAPTKAEAAAKATAAPKAAPATQTAPTKPADPKATAAPVKPKATVALDPAGPGDEDEDEAPTSTGPTVEDDPWGLSQTEIPANLLADNTKLRDVITFLREHAMENQGAELTEDQLVVAVEALRGRVPLVGRVKPEEVPRRVRGVLQVMGSVGKPD